MKTDKKEPCIYDLYEAEEWENEIYAVLENIRNIKETTKLEETKNTMEVFDIELTKTIKKIRNKIKNQCK